MEWSRFSDFPVEIQIRTVLQHAWASISHKLDYKATSEAPIELRRQLFRLSALLELADEDFQSLRDRSRSITDQYRQEVDRGQLDIPLNLDSLTEFLREKVDLQYWAEVGREAGMDMPENYSLLRVEQELSPFLSTLQTVGISTIAQVRSLLDEIDTRRSTAVQWLREFVKLDTAATGFPPDAVAIDVLMVLVAFFCAERLPEGFNWNGIWAASTEAALKKTMADIASSD